LAAKLRSWARTAAPYLEAIRRGEEDAILAELEAAARAHRLLSPFVFAVGGVAILLAGIRLLLVNWRLTVIQLLPAMWLWAAMYDLRLHLIHEDSAISLSGLGLVPVGLAIALVTAACFYLNAVFGFAVAAPGEPSVRAGLDGARRHARTVLVWGFFFGVALAVTATAVARGERLWFTLALGIVVGLMMVAYVAVPARLVGAPQARRSRRDRLSAGAIGAALGVMVSAPPYLLGRIGLLLIGSPVLRVPGFVIFGIGVTLQVGATGAVRAVKMGSKLGPGATRPDGGAAQPTGQVSRGGDR
jgi:uncharacterized membrane protein